MFRRLLAPLAVLAVALSAPPSARADTIFASSLDRVIRIDSPGQQSTFASGFSFVTGLAFAPNGNLFVADNQAGTVLQFSPTGQSLGVFASPGVQMTYSLGSDSSGNLFVTNAGGTTIREYDPTGQLLRQFSSQGSSPIAIVVEGNGNLLVANLNGGQVRRLSPTGADLGVFASVNTPSGLAVDAAGNVYVTNLAANQVQRFSSTGQSLGVFVSGLDSPFGLAFDSAGNLLVVNNDQGNNGTIREFSPSGQPLGTVASGLQGAVALAVEPAPGPATPVPEPGTFLVFGLGLAGLAFRRLWRDRRGKGDDRD
jgi:sugar lactone lactonase YvrE